MSKVRVTVSVANDYPEDNRDVAHAEAERSGEAGAGALEAFGACLKRLHVANPIGPNGYPDFRLDDARPFIGEMGGDLGVLFMAGERPLDGCLNPAMVKAFVRLNEKGDLLSLAKWLVDAAEALGDGKGPDAAPKDGTPILVGCGCQ